MADVFAEAIRGEGYKVDVFTNPLLASEKIGSQHSIYSLVLTGWRMRGLSGIELVLYLSKLDPGIKIILISPLSSEEAYYMMGDVKFDHISMPSLRHNQKRQMILTLCLEISRFT